MCVLESMYILAAPETKVLSGAGSWSCGTGGVSAGADGTGRVLLQGEVEVKSSSETWTGCVWV